MEPHPKPSLLERIGAMLVRAPEDRDQLVELLRSSCERNLIDADVLSMIEGALQVSEMQVGDVMVARSQMDMIDLQDSLPEILEKVIESGHSRFPVYGNDKDDIVGVLLAKDLLGWVAGKNATGLREILRPALFVPESKRLNVLLRDFRRTRNHMAIVVDEYGGVSGLLTIEDVLEQIVGEIEDEHDFDESEENIHPGQNGKYRVKAQTEIADFNKTFGTAFSDDEFATIGGLLLSKFGHLPQRGEELQIDHLKFRVLRADSRRLHTLVVERAANE
ncbi:MAG TPA: transporter associated domain-containing protein [Burkholderiales bacterium]|nr:transporter associated domain-containing protein [Burkholderiales bacterium]